MAKEVEDPFEIKLDYLSTVFTSFVCAFFIHWGIRRLYQFKENSIVIKPRKLKSSFMFKIQTILHATMIYVNCLEILAILLFIQSPSGWKFSSAFLSSILLLISWIIIYFIAQIESTNQITSESPSIQHHVGLQIFWSVRFTIKIITALYQYPNHDFQLFSWTCFYLLMRLILTEAILIIGLYSPGLPPSVVISDDSTGNVGLDVDDSTNELEIENYIEEIVGDVVTSICTTTTTDDDDAEHDDHGETTFSVVRSNKKGLVVLDEEDEEEVYHEHVFQDDEDELTEIHEFHQVPEFVTQFPKWLELLKRVFWPDEPYAAYVKYYCIFYCGCLVIDRGLVIWKALNYKSIVDSFYIGNSQPNSNTCPDNNNNSIQTQEIHWGYLALAFFINVLQYATSTSRSQLIRKIERLSNINLQVQLFEKLHNLSLRWHLETKKRHIIAHLWCPLGHLYYSIEHCLNIIMEWIDILIAIIVVHLNYNENITFLLIYTLICTVALDFIFDHLQTTLLLAYEASTNKKHQPPRKEMDSAIDSIYQYETVKYFNNEAFEVQRFKTAAINYFNLESADNFVNTLIYLLRSFIQDFGLLGSKLFILYILVKHHGISSGDFILLSTIIQKLGSPVSELLLYYDSWTFKLNESLKFEQLLDLKSEIEDDKDAIELKLDDDENSEVSIEFKNVSFHYDKGYKDVLKNVSFFVPPGKTLAIVGPSSSGKSTIAKLLFRFYDSTSGSILVNNQDIKKITQSSLRKIIGIVPQNCVLLNDTIANNILYAKIDDGTMKDVYNAAKAACIHETIISLPNGYNTRVGESGLKLSGGERQKIAIARVLLKNPKIYVLDEATSSLDTMTESKIYESLRKATTNHTTIIIAHRLSTILHADNIIVLKDARVAESGSHDELLRLNGVYAGLWASQSKSLDYTKNPG